MDFLLLVLRKLLNSNSRHVKIILMSATINCREFAEYFATPIWGKMTPAYVYEVEGAPFTIEEFYLDDLQKLYPYRIEPPHPDDLLISPKMYDLAISLIQSFNEMEVEEGGTPLSERGSVLVFLPGIHEIRCMQESLAKLANQRLQVYPLHSSVTLEEQNGVFLSPVPWYRKVILSTNIAESSVTVPDVKYVIDFCLARHLVCDKDTNYQSLRLTWASKTNCNQRKGRAGRVSKGFCYRLVTKAFWTNEIPEYMIPEMQLAPLSTILLKVKLLDMGDPRSLLSTALSPPNLSDIVRTVLELVEMGALSAKSDGRNQSEDGELTFLGRVLAHLPVDLNLGKMIVLGHVFGCLDECLIIGQFDGPDISCSTEMGSSCLLAFSACLLDRQLIYSVLQVAELYEDLKKRVSQFNMHVLEDSPSPDNTSINRQKFILQIVIAGAFYPNYFFQQEIDQRQACKELNGFNPRTTVMVSRNLPPYSFLYYKQLQSLFRLCGQVKTVSFDCSRAYMEFHRTSNDSGVLPEVTLALQMAHKSFKMELQTYPSEQIEFCTGRRSLKSGCISPKVKHKFVFWGVISLQVIDVGHFWGFPADEASLGKQRRLTAEINKCTLSPVTVSLYPNLLCLAPYSETNEESLYYRAKILHMRGNTVEVFFLDFGNTALVSSSSLRELPSDLLAQPFQAHEFQVAGMRPSAQSIILGNKWSSRARDCFVTMVKHQSVIVSLYSILYGVMRVELLLSRESKSTSVVDILVEEGHAVKAEENVDSQLNLEKVSRFSYMCCPVGGSISPTLFSVRASTSDKSFLLIIQVNLVGPSSSYQTNFYSLSRKTHYSGVLSCRTVSMEKNSINSVTLNENPHFKHQRMMVAGMVAINTSGSHILLSDTSILPDIPGLPGLVMMLFTPAMELRFRSYYTGALCGLGFNSLTKEPILPENDIELAFDVKFDVMDIIEVTTVTSNNRNNVIKTYFTLNQMDIAERGSGEARGVLFQLHSPILLNR
uniref:RNA helicase n=1 Tax=Poecilia reticulata TaxID=8081 RepID=A0A3P9PL23_POERE